MLKLPWRVVELNCQFSLKFQFKNLLMQSSLASQYLSNELTVFAPSDGAMAKYTGPKDDQFIMNHMGKNLISIYYLHIAHLINNQIYVLSVLK